MPENMGPTDKQMSNPLHFKLASGRVIFLKEPLTADELEAFSTPEGMAHMEILADWIAKRCKGAISQDSPEGVALLEKHGIQP